MSDLISRKAALEAVEKAATKECARWVIKELPSAQPEIITCIDCIHYTPFGEDKECGRCSVNQRMCQSCDFCAWAERIEEDG